MSNNSESAGRAPVVRRILNRLEQWDADVRGAALVQFIAVLPLFLVIVIGVWALYQAYASQQTLCEATWQAARYLLVEGPLLPEDQYPYPDGWARVATDIINSEIKSQTTLPIKPLEVSQVTISPSTKPFAPTDITQVRDVNVPNSWFFVQAQTEVKNPMAMFLPGQGTDGNLSLVCKRTGYFEGPPIGPTQGPKKPPRRCPSPPKRCPRATVGPPPPANATATPTVECPCEPR